MKQRILFNLSFNLLAFDYYFKDYYLAALSFLFFAIICLYHSKIKLRKLLLSTIAILFLIKFIAHASDLSLANLYIILISLNASMVLLTISKEVSNYLELISILFFIFILICFIIPSQNFYLNAAIYNKYSIMSLILILFLPYLLANNIRHIKDLIFSV